MEKRRDPSIEAALCSALQKNMKTKLVDTITDSMREELANLAYKEVRKYLKENKKKLETTCRTLIAKELKARMPSMIKSCVNRTQIYYED